MFEKKLHYKMYKAGKHWVFAAITVGIFGFASTTSALADETSSSNEAQTEQTLNINEAADTTTDVSNEEKATEAKLTTQAVDTASSEEKTTNVEKEVTTVDANKDTTVKNVESSELNTTTVEDKNAVANTDQVNTAEKENKYTQENVNGNWYLKDEQGNYLTGFQEIKDQNKTVYYNPDSKQMVYGQQNINGNWYLFDTFNGAMQTGLQYIRDQKKLAYYNEQGQMQGTVEIDVQKYQADTFDGAIKGKGQTKIADNWYLFNNAGQVVDGWQWINDQGKTVYYSTKTAQMVHGQQNINGHWYLFDKTTGAMQRGFQNLKAYGDDKTVYYNQDGWMIYGQQKIDNKWYNFDTFNGAMKTGIVKIPEQNKTVYYAPNGQMQYGWQWVDNATRYFDTFNGAMATGQKLITGHWYLFDKDGAMQRGIQYIPEENKLVYYNQDGWMLYGKQNINGVDHNFNTFNGALEAKGQVKVGNNWYLFNNSGTIQTGFQDLKAYGQDKVVYYDPKTAAMVYGYQNIDGNWYLFSRANGSMQRGLQNVNGVDLLFDEKTGALLTGVQNIKGNNYFVDKRSGNIKKNLVVLGADNKWMYFDAKTGKGTNTLEDQYKKGVISGNVEFITNNAAYSFDGNSFENINGFLTADSWYRPKSILKDGSTWTATTETDLRPLLMTWWPNEQIKANYLNYMKDKGFINNSGSYNAESDPNYMDFAAQEAQRNIERKITKENDTTWLRDLITDFIKTQDIWNEQSEGVSTEGLQKFQGGFLKYVNSELTPYANSEWRKLGYQPTMLTQNNVGAEFLLANDIDNSNPVVQAEQLNWLHFLMNFGTITANDPGANFDGIRIDAVDNVDASLLSIAGDYLKAAYKVGQNDATANKHISILEDWNDKDPEYVNSIGNPQLTMDDYIVQQLKFSLGQAPDKVDRMQRFKEWYLVDRSKDNTENTAIPNYSFVRAHDASVQEDILQLIQDTTGKPWGVYTNEELQQGLKDYMADQKLTNKKYNRYNIPSSYAILLTNKDTIPRVYYGDLYSDAGKYMAEKSIYFDAIDNLLKTRTKYIAGGQTLDVDGHDVLTSVRFGKGALNVTDKGTSETRTQGMGLIISNNNSLKLNDGEKVVLHMGAAHKNQAYRAVMLSSANGLINYTSDANAPVVYTNNDGDLIFTNKDVVTNGKVQANTAIKGVMNPYVSGYLAMWVPVGASVTQDARTAASTKTTTDGSVFRSNAALDSNLIYEGFSNFQAFPENASENANAIIAQNVGLFNSWGVTSFQLAPQYVSSHDGSFLDSIIDNGYAFTDRYDLAMSKNNKYGSYQDLVNVLKALHAGGIQVIADWVPDQIYSLPGKEVVSVVRSDEFGNKVDGTQIDNTLYVVNTIGGGQYQKEYGGRYLEELKQKYPELFKTKQPSTGVTIDPSEKITEWSAKYLNGTNILHRGAEFVLRDGATYFRVAETSEVFLPSQLRGKITKNGFWKNDAGKVNYYNSEGEIMKNAFVKDGKNNWYYFDNDGNMVTNTALTIDSDAQVADYYFLSNGISLRDGFVQLANGDVYYYDINGRKLKNGKVTVNNVEYTTDKNGKVVGENILKKLDEIITTGKTTLI
uniref:dextransucrase n=1 Tax=Ligilactobacillus animalis TaxID=1605 RepID=L8BSI9_9LACO|nr:dextransucrase [Ligilactobacillus animalis]